MYTAGFRLEQREEIGHFFNPILAEKGFKERINVQSYKEMGLDIESHVHEGPYARKLAQTGHVTRISLVNESITDDNRDKLLKNTHHMLKLLAANFATFTEKNMYDFIDKHMKHDALLTAHVFEKVKAEVVKISGYSRDANVYTTKAYKAHEERAIKISNAMLTQKTSLCVRGDKIDDYLSSLDDLCPSSGAFPMSDEQKNAVRLLCSDHALTYLVGRAGTGKTTALKAVVDLLRGENIAVYGAAIAAEAAQNIEHEAGVSSYTVASYLFSLKMLSEKERALERVDLSLKERQILLRSIASLKAKCIAPKSVLIVDEAGMVGVEHFSQLFDLAQSRDIKLILVGDDRQFKSVDSGDLFRYLIEKSADASRQSVLSQNYRQAKVPWMRQASMQFAALNSVDSLKAYDDHHCIHRFESEEALLWRMAQDYLAIPSDESCCVLSYTREKVDALNDAIRKGLHDLGRLPLKETTLFNKNYAVGDQLIFLKNARQTTAHQEEVEGLYLRIEGPYATTMKVRNGMRGTILRIDKIEHAPQHALHEENIYCVEVRVNDNHQAYVVTFWTNTVRDFSHGYATTLHKSQGQTVDHTLLYLTKPMDLYATYVAFTRHRLSLGAYHLRSDFPTFNSLCDNLGKIHVKDLIQDYAFDGHNPDVVDMVLGYKQMGIFISQLLNGASDEEKKMIPYLMEEKAFRAQQMLADFPSYGAFLLSRGMTQKQLEIAAGYVERVLSREEREIISIIQAYVDVSRSCREVYEELIKTHASVYIKDHEDYEQLIHLQERRGEIAHLLHQTPVLLEAYAKDIFKECGYGLKTVEKQADGYLKNRVKKEVFSSLSEDDQAHVIMTP